MLCPKACKSSNGFWLIVSLLISRFSAIHKPRKTQSAGLHPPHIGRATRSCASLARILLRLASPHTGGWLLGILPHHEDAAWSQEHRQSDGRSVPGPQNASKRCAQAASISKYR